LVLTIWKEDTNWQAHDVPHSYFTEGARKFRALKRLVWIKQKFELRLLPLTEQLRLPQPISLVSLTSLIRLPLVQVVCCRYNFSNQYWGNNDFWSNCTG